ncbi:coat protein [Spatholobus suberectus]|nr:coat protein [Spatholobus suberectus]
MADSGSLAKQEQRLRDFRLRAAAKRKGNRVQTRVQTNSDPAQERFADVPEINFTADMRLVSYDFPDGKLLGRSGIQLPRLDTARVCELGRTVLPMMASGFNYQAMAAIFVLTYHLKAPGQTLDDAAAYLFNSAEDLQQSGDLSYTDCSDEIITVHAPKQVMAATRDPKKEANVYAYIAASTLRLFTKPPANYVRAWNHILEGYSNHVQTLFIQWKHQQPTVAY